MASDRVAVVIACGIVAACVAATLVLTLTVVASALPAAFLLATYGTPVLVLRLLLLDAAGRRRWWAKTRNTADSAGYAVGHSFVRVAHAALSRLLTAFGCRRTAETPSPELRALELIVRATRDPREMTLHRFRKVCEGYHFLFWYQKPVHRDVVELQGTAPDRTVCCHFMRTAVEPEAAPPIILYLHGGGFIGGSASAYRGMISPVAKRLNCNVFAVEYRKMPEHPLQGAVDDAVLAYRYLIERKKICPQRVVLAGDSAGGSLCLLLLLAFKEKRLPHPAGAMLMSPYVDLTVSKPSWERNRGKDFILHEKVIDGARAMFAQQQEFTVEMARKFSPALFAPDAFTGLPPLFVSNSTMEPLQDEIEEFVDKARKAGVEIEQEERPHCPHVFQMFYAYCPEGSEVMDKGIEFLENCLAKSRTS